MLLCSMKGTPLPLTVLATSALGLGLVLALSRMRPASIAASSWPSTVIASKPKDSNLAWIEPSFSTSSVVPIAW